MNKLSLALLLSMSPLSWCQQEGNMVIQIMIQLPLMEEVLLMQAESEESNNFTADEEFQDAQVAEEEYARDDENAGACSAFDEEEQNNDNVDSASLQELIERARHARFEFAPKGQENLKLNLTKTAQEIAVLGFKIAVFKKKNRHDDYAWRSIIKKFVQWVRNVEDTSLLVELAKECCRHATEENGIGFGIDVQFSDGQCGVDCEESCACIERYEGTCPCEVMDNACSSGEGMSCCHEG